MITRREDYDYITIDSDIKIDGAIMPQRDVDGVGSSSLRGEDIAFVNERVCELAGDDRGFLPVSRSIDPVIRGNRILATRMALQEIANIIENHSMPQQISQLTSTWWNGLVFANNTPVNMRGGYSLYTPLNSELPGANGFYSRAMTEALKYALNSNDVRPTVLMPSKESFPTKILAGDDIRKLFYYLQPLTRQVFIGDMTGGYDRPKVIKDGDVFTRAFESSISYPVYNERGEVIDVEDRVTKVSESPGGSGWGTIYDMYRRHSSEHPDRFGGQRGYSFRYLDATLARINLPFPIWRYRTFVVLRGMKRVGTNDPVYKYAVVLGGTNSMLGTRAQRMYFDMDGLSQNSRRMHTRQWLLDVVNNAFGYPRSLDTCQMDEHYEVVCYGPWLIVDRDLKTEFESIGWTWQPVTVPDS